jgi:hypothetical protein
MCIPAVRSGSKFTDNYRGGGGRTVIFASVCVILRHLITVFDVFTSSDFLLYRYIQSFLFHIKDLFTDRKLFWTKP